MPAKRFRVDPSYLSIPPTAWPTVILFLVSMAAFFAPILLYWLRGVTTWWTMLPSTVSIFALFTPMHDAAHRSVSRQHRWLNEAVGWACGLVFATTFPAFRHVHFQHHKFTNDPERDPDHWSGSGAILLLPIRWMVQNLQYYIPIYKASMSGLLSQREGLFILFNMIAIYSSFISLMYMGYGWQVLRLWLIPETIASGLLAYTFDYIPHRPHDTLRRENIYKCTNKIDGLLTTGGVDLSIPLLYQNYHNVHHLYPQIPFYRYIAVWQKFGTEMIRQGTPVVPAFDQARPWL